MMFKKSDKSAVYDYSKLMFWKKRRVVLAVASFCGFAISHALRANLSIAIIAMTENKTITYPNGTTTLQEAEFTWDSKIQGHILSSFFYGYFLGQLFWGLVAAKIGGALVLGGGNAVVSVLTLLTPWMAKINIYLLITLRIIEGFFAAVTLTGVSELLANWAPPLERSRFIGFIYSGIHVGTLISMALFGYLSEHLGWPSIFYVSGACGVVWFVFWQISVREKPADDSRISKKELEYITTSLENTSGKSMTYPWKDIFTSLPVWAIVVAHIADSWILYVFAILVPQFMNDILNSNLSTVGFLSAMPFLVMIVTIQVSGFLADWLLEKNLLTVTQLRKTYTCVAFLCSGTLLLVVAFLNKPRDVIICLLLAAVFEALCESGSCTNHLDIAPRHASVIVGIANTAAEMGGVLIPVITGHVVTTPTAEEWQILFYSTFGICLFSGVFFGLFASGDLQSWSTESTQEQNQAKREIIDCENHSGTHL